MRRSAVLLALACLLVSGALHAQTFTLARPACYLSNFDWQVRSLPNGARTIVWFCETPQGMRWYSRSENTPQSAFTVVAKTDAALWAIDQAKTNRPHTTAESVLISAVERTRGPRCVTQLSGTATTVPVYARNADGTRTTLVIARIAPGAWANCYDWTKPSTVRFCSVANQPSTTGAIIAAGVARCALQRPPGEGWEAE